MGSSCGTSCAGKRPCAELPTRGSRSPRSRRRPSGCVSAPWSHRCHDADRSRSPARPRPWTSSAAAASPSASESAKTGSLASSRRPASSSTTGPGARCSTRHWRSSPPPGAVSRFTTTATTTRSTTSSSCRGRCSDPASRCGSLAFPATPGRCGEPPGTTASSPSTSSIPTSSPRSSPRSQRSDRIRRQRTTSSSVPVVLVTGGAGYLGSTLVPDAARPRLRRGRRSTASCTARTASRLCATSRLLAGTRRRPRRSTR